MRFTGSIRCRRPGRLPETGQASTPVTRVHPVLVDQVVGLAVHDAAGSQPKRLSTLAPRLPRRLTMLSSPRIIVGARLALVLPRVVRREPLLRFSFPATSTSLLRGVDLD